MMNGLQVRSWPDRRVYRRLDPRIDGLPLTRSIFRLESATSGLGPVCVVWGDADIFGELQSRPYLPRMVNSDTDPLALVRPGEGFVRKCGGEPLGSCIPGS